MSMASFAELSLTQFLETHCDERNLWLFVHIPKTAGSSLSTEISRELTPYRNIHIDSTEKGVEHAVQVQNAVNRFIAESGSRNFRSASGHIDINHVNQIRGAVPAARTFTFLRHPVKRLISDFRYQRTPLHPPYKEFIERFPTIESYVTSEISQNRMYRTLVRDETVALQEGLDQIANDFTFVGTLEMYPMSFNILFRLFGLDLMPGDHKRATPQTEHNAIEDTPELRNRILAANSLDMALYRHFAEMLRARREQWIEIRKGQRAPHAGTAAVAAGH
jgi:hypothetical protein